MIPADVTIVEVGPRDGLQNESQIVSTEIKIEWIKKLIAAGLNVIEPTSFVSPKWVPQLSDAKEIQNAVNSYPTIRFPVLIPNLKGLELALANGAKEIAVFTTPSETFSQKNTNCSVEESLERIQEIASLAGKAKLKMRGYLSCVIACPYEGPTKPALVTSLAEKLLDLGCDEISLGDTTGVGTITTIKQLLDNICQKISAQKLAVHFHDTYGQALVNIYESLHYGIKVIDASTSGIGGCPYAAGASGNVATEDVVYMLNGLNINTNIDLAKLIDASLFISRELKRLPRSKVAIAYKNSHI